MDEAVVKQSMAEIIASGIINTANGNLVSPQGARIVVRNITDYELA
ncbi:DUF2922 domain-containing protein [Neobacillus ginsengisoli]|nr:DUF2922 domain-containing protein [Neobacillus ginsengisoli]